MSRCAFSIDSGLLAETPRSAVWRLSLDPYHQPPSVNCTWVHLAQQDSVRSLKQDGWGVRALQIASLADSARAAEDRLAAAQAQFAASTAAVDRDADALREQARAAAAETSELRRARDAAVASYETAQAEVARLEADLRERTVDLEHVRSEQTHALAVATWRDARTQRVPARLTTRASSSPPASRAGQNVIGSGTRQRP
jgi:hypothetical protein